MATWPGGAYATTDREATAVRPPPDFHAVGTPEAEDAVAEALDRARLSLEGIAAFEVQRISGAVDGSATTYEVQLRVWFTLLERMHG